MKTLAAFLMMTILSCSASYAEETGDSHLPRDLSKKDATCLTIGKISSAAMFARQNGLPLVDTLKFMRETAQNPTQEKIFVAISLTAYNVPIDPYADTAIDSKLVTEFSNKWVLNCYQEYDQ